VDVDGIVQVELFAAAPTLRQKLQRLRAELRGVLEHPRWREIYGSVDDQVLP